MKSCVEQPLFTMLIMIMLLASSVSQAAKILIPGSLKQGRGHTTQLAALTAELTSRGHHVTILVPSDDDMKIGEKFADSKPKEILKYQTTPVEVPDHTRVFQLMNISDPKDDDRLLYVKHMFEVQVSYCRQLINNTSIMKKLSEENFDLIIEDMSNICDVLLPEALQVPFAALTSDSEFLLMNRRLYGFPLELSYVISRDIIRGSDDHSFWIRVKNVLSSCIYIKVYTYRTLYAPFQTLQHEFNIGIDTDFLTLAGKAQLWMSQASYIFESPQPIMPNWIPVGGMAAARPGRLAPDYLEFVAGSGEAGFIVISNTSSNVIGLSANMTESIASVLKKLPQRVVWKYSGPTPKNLGSNTRVSPWIPQAALLAHPNARLFITHGGLNSIYQALYNGVPMILIPKKNFNEPKLNAQRVERLGFGLCLDKTYSADLLESKIKQILNDSSFTEKIRQCSAILQDDDPMDRAVYWVEHVIKFGGSHLRADVFNLSFVEYYMLDVFAFFIFLFIVFVLVIYFACVSCCSLCKRCLNRAKTDKID